MTATASDKVSRFFTSFPLRVFDERQLLLRPGEPLPGIFYLLDGRVSEYDVSPTGTEVVVNVFKPGAFFPMSIALNNTPNDYFFEATTKVTAHVAPPNDAVQFLQDNPDVTLDLLRRVYRGTDGVLRRMAHLMGGGARNRLIFELLNATQRFGNLQPDGTTFLKFNESDLARHSGLARETISRNIQALKTAGLLEISGNGIILKNIAQLKDLLGTEL